MNLSKEKIWQYLEKTIDWCLFITFVIVSFALVQDVWLQYLSKKHCISWEEVPITELPTLTLCFGNEADHEWKVQMYDLGTDFNVTYFVNDT